MATKTIIVILFLLIMGFSLTEIQKAKSQNSVYPLASGIFIISPTNATYNSELLILNTSINIAVGTNIQVFMTYSLDGTENKTLPTRTLTRDNSFLKQIIGSTNLQNLTNGPHNITIYTKYTNNNQIIGNETSTVHFAINYTPEPIPEFSTQYILILIFLATTTPLLYRRYKPF